MINAHILIGLSILFVITMPASWAGDKQAVETGKPQSKCPILGGKINKDVFVDYEGKRVYFCCPACDKKFLANADALIEKMEDKGITLADAPVKQTMCPVSDEAIDKAVFVMHEGRKVFFCCKMCKGDFKKDPQKYMKKLDAEDKGAKHDMKKDKKHDDHGHHGHH